MTPADNLASAMSHLCAALDGLQRQHADVVARDSVAAAMAYTRTAIDQLPGLIHSGEFEHCSECGFSRGMCTNDDAYQCPAVQAAGFTDPSRPELSVPAYLRRQAT